MESNNDVPNDDSDVGASGDVLEGADVAEKADSSNPISENPGTKGKEETVTAKSELMDSTEADDAGRSEGDDAGRVEGDAAMGAPNTTQDLGIDDEMKAMFGEETSPDVSRVQQNVVESGQPGGESVSPNISDPVTNESKATCDLDQTPDESNLEDMMEAMHADKVESSQAVQKQAETSGLELKDVLQALTGDLEESSNDCSDKQKSKHVVDNKGAKRRAELEILKVTAAESDGERTFRDRSKQTPKSSDSKRTPSDSKSLHEKKTCVSEEEEGSDEEEKPKPKKRGRPPKKKDTDENRSDEGEKSQPKRRGRPPKKHDEVESDQSGGHSSDEEEKPQPKKRGRPPKKKDTDENSSDEDGKSQPKRRGRPSKKKDEVESDQSGGNSSDEEEKPQPKRRGRPSKKKDEVESDQSGGNSSDEEEKPQPKRRGRPSKKKDEVESDQSGGHSSDEEEKPQPKKRGRPPKKKDNVETDQSGGHSSDEEEKPQPKKRGRPPKKKDTDKSEENSSGEEGSKSKKPGSRKIRTKSHEFKDLEKDTPKTPARKPGPKSARSKSMVGDSDSDHEPSSNDLPKSRKGRKPLPGTELVSRSNKVCIIGDCRQQCFPQLGISLHRFPVGPGSIRKYWLKLVNHEPPGPTTAYICSQHFTDNDYNYDDKKDPSHTFYRKLKVGAIPSVALPVNDKVFQKVKADVEFWKKTVLKVSLDSSIDNDSNRKRKPGRPQEKSGTEEAKGELQTVDSEDEVDLEADSKGKPGRSGSGPSKAQSATAKSTKEQGEETKKGGPDKTKRAASRSPSPSSTTLQASSAKISAHMIRKKPEPEARGRTPGTNCSVPCCGNNLFETRAEGLSISYYRFPFDNDLADKWIKKIGDLQLNARTARICSDHFAEKDFDGTGGGRRNLKPKAVPSLYLIEKKPREGDSDDEDDEYERTVGRRRTKSKAGGLKKGKPDTSFISMPLPIIVDFKSEPSSDDEIVGQDYTPSDPGSEPEEPVPSKKFKMDRETNQDQDNDDENEVRTFKGGSVKDSPGPQAVQTVSLATLALPVVSLERLGKRVIDAADSGSLRVKIKESDKATKAVPKQKPGPKSKRKRVDSDTEATQAHPTGSRPGPLSKKKIYSKLDDTPVVSKRFGPKKKLLKFSDNESESDVDNPPSPSSGVENDLQEQSVTITKSSNSIQVKPAELPKFLRDRSIERNPSDDDMICEVPRIGLDSILDRDKSDKNKLIQLVEQRISEHTKIIEGRTMGAQQLADHNKILQGSALVLKKLAEKSGKPSPALPISVPESSRTIVLRKVSDPIKLGLKPPISRVVTSKDSSPSSPAKSPLLAASPLNSARSTPSKFSKALGENEVESKATSSLEKIRDYDNLMKKYLSAVLDKNVMSKKYTECKEAQTVLEIKLNEKIKELELVKRKVSTLQAKINKTTTALEYFLTPNQIKLALQETKKVAWSPEEMLTAFTIKHLSKACYLFLRHKLNYPLPGISSLQRWMTMLSKDKAEDDEDNIADEDASDKEESQEILEEGPGVVNEITGTLEEINACGAPGEENYQPEDGGENVKDSNQSSPFQFVLENDGNDNSKRKVIILKKMAKEGNGKMKSKLQISASENDVNVSNIEESGEKNALYKLLSGAKTISMASSPLGSQKRRFVVPKKMKEKERISFQRLPQVRKDMSIPKPPRIQIVKNEPQEVFARVQQFDEGVEQNADAHMIQVAASDLVETVVNVKAEMTAHVPGEQQQQGETPQKFFTISDLNSSQMEEHIVENVEHMTEDGQQVGGEVMQETLISGDGMQSITIVKEGDVVGHHSGEAIEGMVAMAGDQQITFATADDIGRGHFAQIAYAQGQHGEITLHEDINNMTAVVINDIDDEQLNTLLLSNVVEQKGVEIQGDQAYGQKKIVYQTIDHDKNVIVLQPDSQAFIEEDEGTSGGGAPRVYIINDEGHIVSTPGSETPGLAQEISFIDSSAFAEIQSLGYKLSNGDPDQPFTIGNFIENYAIASPTKPFKKS